MKSTKNYQIKKYSQSLSSHGWSTWAFPARDRKFSGYIPFYQTKDESASPAPDKVELEIKDGKFTCTSTTADKVAVKSADKTGFIAGGFFSEKPADAYIAEGYKAVESGTGWEVAKKSAE